ncbi:signal peptide-containing protein [Theileria equi strain WA]|uniref:Signal peptide-containing protein n=1 Tax=Theileria equi strain WA TaxID=1537102 RepID=L0AWI6_THEEQ|nr:signal peptide-containing protein [Theileria equi strain WA]AFZ79895.1 signal peptide-containing protein [Theileria equi strain WA]|eukprot:XP_004829561.1 signal peptide-containing protein [Theileria equi strain WA]
MDFNMAFFLLLVPVFRLGVFAGETIDIAEEMQGRNCTVVVQERGDISFTIYSRMPRVNVSKIVYNDQILWETTENDILYHHFTVYRLYKKPVIAYLYFTDARKFDYVQFKFENGVWIRVNDGEYQRLMEKMQNERTFDIKRPDIENLVKMEEYSPFGITARIYMNNSKFRIGTIVDGEDVLWESKSWEERCEHIIVHGSPADPKLVHMFIKLADNHKVLYFDKQGDNWVEVEKEQFFETLQELDNACEEDERP